MARRGLWVIGGVAVGAGALVLSPEAHMWLRRRLGLEAEDRRWFEEDAEPAEHEGDETLDTREARYSLRARLSEEGHGETEPAAPSATTPDPPAPAWRPSPVPAPAWEPPPPPATAPEPPPAGTSEPDVARPAEEDTAEIPPLPPASSWQPPAAAPPPTELRPVASPAEAPSARNPRPFSGENVSFRSAIDAARERVHGAAREATPATDESTEPTGGQS